MDVHARILFRLFGALCLFAVGVNIWAYFWVRGLPGDFELSVAASLLLLLGAFSNAAGLLLGPGLFLNCRFHLPAKWAAPSLFLPGTLWLGLVGGILWLLHSELSSLVCNLLCTPSLIFIGGYFLQRSSVSGLARDTFNPSDTYFLFKVILIVCAIASGKSLYSLGPIGELYAGTISRTHEVGDRSDGRICFHNIQVFAHGLSPTSDTAKGYFAPYTFFSRGPLPGLVATVGVILSGADVPVGMPDHKWRPFDRQGFMAYRVFMVFLASFVGISFFYAVKLVSGKGDAAVVALSLFCTTPFFLHDLYFTWPKWLAASLVLLSFGALGSEEFVVAGLFLVVGYLCHPLALLSFPFLALTILGDPFALRRNRKFLTELGKVLKFVLTAGLLLGGWFLLIRGHFSQGRFFDYLFQADGGVNPGLKSWLYARMQSALNTFVPFYLPVFHSDHRAINSVYGPSPPVIHFFFQYWNSLPFALGITSFFYFIRSSVLNAVRFPRHMAALVLLPWIFFVLYWGEVFTGLMREGGHVFFAAFIGFTVWAGFEGNRPDGVRLATALVSKRLVGLRLLECLAMMFVPTWVTMGRLVQPGFVVTDCLALSIVFLGLYSLFKCLAEELRVLRGAG